MPCHFCRKVISYIESPNENEEESDCPVCFETTILSHFDCGHKICTLCGNEIFQKQLREQSNNLSLSDDINEVDTELEYIYNLNINIDNNEWLNDDEFIFNNAYVRWLHSNTELEPILYDVTTDIFIICIDRSSIPPAPNGYKAYWRSEYSYWTLVDSNLSFSVESYFYHIFTFCTTHVKWTKHEDFGDIAVLIETDNNQLCKLGSWSKAPWAPGSYLPFWVIVENMPHLSRWILIKEDEVQPYGLTFNYDGVLVQWKEKDNRVILIENPSLDINYNSWRGSNYNLPWTPRGYKPVWCDSYIRSERKWILQFNI